MSYKNHILIRVLKSFSESTGKKTFAFIIFFAIVVFWFNALQPIIITKVISEIEIFLTSWVFDTELFVFLLVFWWVYIVLQIILAYVFDYCFSMKYSVINFHDVVRKYSIKIIEMWYGEYLTKKTWSIYKILDRWSDSQFYLTRDLIAEVLANIVTVVIWIAVLFYFDAKMALITLAPLPIMMFIGYYLYAKLAPSQWKMDKKYDEVFSDIGNVMSNFWLTKTLYLENYFIKKIQSTLDINYKTQVKLNAGWSLSHVYVQAIIMLARILVIGFWSYFIMQWEFTFALLFLFFTYVNFIYYPMSFIFMKLRQFQKQFVSVERMYDEFDKLEKDDGSIWKSLKSISWEIEYKNVSFSYDEERSILSDINFTIKKWEKVALVWNTGAGKSTLINLLLRFWEIHNGEINLDGKNIAQYKKSHLRGHIGVVSQDNSLFNLSIEENLKFANPKASKKDIENALKMAEAHFVFDLKSWIKTVIGERGLKLSGGEKQRISIARLFLKNPEILILDEATSALDNTTEKKIEKALKKLMKWKTSIIIAHRLSTIRHVDTIFVLEKWKIVEVGDYDELMKKKSKFYALANPDKLILW